MFNILTLEVSGEDFFLTFLDSTFEKVCHCDMAASPYDRHYEGFFLQELQKKLFWEPRPHTTYQHGFEPNIEGTVVVEVEVDPLVHRATDLWVSWI